MVAGTGVPVAPVRRYGPNISLATPAAAPPRRPRHPELLAKATASSVTSDAHFRMPGDAGPYRLGA
jgi:hypothetical protein